MGWEKRDALFTIYSTSALAMRIEGVHVIREKGYPILEN